MRQIGMFVFFFLALLVSAGKGLTADRTFVDRENALSSAPEGWLISEKPDPSTSLSVTIALKQRNVDMLESIFWAVSDPQNPKYGQYLSLNQLTELLAPPMEDIQKITTWLKSQGVKEIELMKSKDFLQITLPISLAETLFQCEFFYFIHESTSSPIKLIRTLDAYSLPSDIASLVDFVGDISNFPRVKVAKISSEEKNLVDIWVDPNLLHKQYNVPTDAKGVAANNSQSVVQFIGQYYSAGDLELFFDLFWGAARGNTPKIVGPDSGSPGLEASLDIEYIMSLGTGINTTFWSNKAGGFLSWITAVANTENPPLVFSVSYGENEDAVGVNSANRVNVEFMKQGVRGISIMFASGDSGVGGTGFGCKKFVPDFPASSPYITAVGGTTLGILETGAESGNSISGGGFSNYFSRPSYQTDAVNQYLTSQSSSLPTSSKWNSTGRGYPDVSALSASFVVVMDRIPVPGIAGTSCASPTFSGIIALLNDIQLQAGKPSLGFLNPWLYQNMNSLNDITKGNNPGCGTNGFSAAAGWDPVTGIGSPNYGNMAQVLP